LQGSMFVVENIDAVLELKCKIEPKWFKCTYRMRFCNSFTSNEHIQERERQREKLNTHTN